MKKLLFALFLFCNSFCFSQEELFEYSPEVVSWIAQCSSRSGVVTCTYINLYINLERYSVNLGNYDRLWVMGIDIQANARVSLINPTSTNLTEVNSITWTQNKGYTGNGTNMYINTNYTASTQAVHYGLNQMAFGIYIATSSNSGTTAPFGCDGTGATHGLFSGTSGFCLINGGTQSSGNVTGGLFSGNFIWLQQSSAIHCIIEQNATAIQNNASTPVALPTAPFFLFNRNNGSGTPQAGQYATGRYSMAWIGTFNSITKQNSNAHEIASLFGW